MKKLFIICSLILAAAFFIRCEKESIFLPENASDQSFGKEKLNAREYPTIPAGDLYALEPWNDIDNIGVYNYNPTTDEIVLNEGFKSTGLYYNFGFDFNKEDELIYLLAGTDSTGESIRNLYTWDKETNETALIEQIISVEGNYYPQDLTFGNDGILYFAFKNGEINSYDVTNNIMSAFSTIPGDSFGGVGLTYNFNNNQLIYAQSYDPVQLFSIDIPSGNVTALFDYYTLGTSSGTGQAIEYVGNDKLIASSTFSYNTIYTVDIRTKEVKVLLSPTGFRLDIKDLMFINPDSDSDDDGIIDDEDNCPLTANADQADTDADGVGDVCDECVGFDDTLDADGDGVPDGCDICPGSDDLLDSDIDGVPDGCDNCPFTANADQADNDADGVGDGCDNCPDISNTNQTDTDNDGLGDVCDDDIDGDGDLNINDNCPNTPNADQANNDSDSQGDVCDTDDDNDGCIDTNDTIDFSNMETTVNIDGCDTGVLNEETSTCGIMMSDRIDELEAGTYTKKDTFIKAVTKLTTEWLQGGLITKAEKNLILKCARNASI